MLLDLKTNTKRCGKCKRSFPPESFWKTKSRKDGLQDKCKDCQRQVGRAWARSPAGKAHVVVASAKYRSTAHGRQRRLEGTKKFHERNPEYRAAYNRAYEIAHRSERRAAEQRRYNTQPDVRLARIMRAALRRSVHGAKPGRTFALLGFSAAQLEARLRETMPEGYTWDDFMNGKLHVDHVTPIRAFAVSAIGDDAFKTCWALSNLQLLPALVNKSKGDKLPNGTQARHSIPAP